MPDAAKIASIVAAARTDDLQVEHFSIVDAVTPAAGITFNDPYDAPNCYISGVEAVLNFDAVRAASAGLTESVIVQLGTLAEPLRPTLQTEGLGFCYTGAAFIMGYFYVGDGVGPNFVPFESAAAGAGFEFRARSLRAGPPIGLISDSVS